MQQSLQLRHPGKLSAGWRSCLRRQHFREVNWNAGKGEGGGTRGKGVGGGVDDGGVEVRLGEGGVHRAHDAAHLPEGVLVAVVHLELVPGRPEVLVRGGVCQAGGVHQDGSRPVHLPHSRLQLGVPTE